MNIQLAHSDRQYSTNKIVESFIITLKQIKMLLISETSVIRKVYAYFRYKTEESSIPSSLNNLKRMRITIIII